MRADLNLIDLDHVSEGHPHIVDDLPWPGGRRLMQRSVGYVATVVNGEVVLRDGELTVATACRDQPTTQGGGCALGDHMPTAGEDYLPLHEMSTNSKRTTCLPPDMACEVHHTKSGYEQLKSRNSPFRPTRS